MGSRGGARPKTRPDDRRGGARPGPRPGRPKEYEVIRLTVADADLIRAACRMEDLQQALERIAAAQAADPAGTQSALAPLVEIEAWDGGVI